MDRFPEYVQVISLAAPQIEALGDPPLAAELATIANDGMAELVVKYPDRFPGFIASLAMNNVQASLAEIDRAVLKPWGGRHSDLFERERQAAGRSGVFAHLRKNGRL